MRVPFFELLTDLVQEQTELLRPVSEADPAYSDGFPLRREPFGVDPAIAALWLLRC